MEKNHFNLAVTKQVNGTDVILGTLLFSAEEAIDTSALLSSYESLLGAMADTHHGEVLSDLQGFKALCLTAAESVAAQNGMTVVFAEADAAIHTN